ncbi:DNA helicase-2 / ATP-dependent DNA helicase PcrA [Natronincola peptidivorans]|uniref:DNA 3'-5' helicase n=1 Tax=Natronincola peptidivorans TaxID=426128 RepID=A0A1H9Y8L4_9FIRM|nr:ATP-dependent helicase [Natronincola peptidivorans]SES65253.1 DNA helicase-2 / ATP-dependent DNA helicase PcrA [Natronincola peptidivorans]
MLEIQLNKQQRLASLHKDGPAIVLAVAGAGKTTTLCARTANLILKHKVDPLKIKTMTFSRAAARDMKEKFISLSGEGIKKANAVDFSTIHSFAFSVIKYYYKHKNIPLIVIENEKEEINKYSILKDIFKNVSNEYITEEQLEELLTYITYTKNMMHKPKEIEGLNTTIKNFPLIFETYENIKKEKNYLDYDDMLTVMYNILLDEPKLLKAIQNKYQYWQVDEFQDTSIIQYEILKLLAKPKNNLFCVGDDDQTLYSWRGSYPRILLEFPKVFKKTQVYFMEENYRSTETIIRLSNEIIALNQQRYEKSIFTQNEKGFPVLIEEFNNENTQIKTIVQEITQKKQLQEVAILFRNSFSAMPFIDSFQENNIPFYIREHKMSFLKHWIAKDISSFIQLAYKPYDLELFRNIYYKLNAFLTKQSMSYVAQELEKIDFAEREEINIFDVLLTYPHLQYYQKEKILKIKYDFGIFRKQNTNNFMQFIRKRLRYNEYLEKQELTSKEVVNNTIGVLEYLANNVTTGLEFLDKIKGLNQVIKEASANKGKGVVLSTIHSAKGLEFDDVYVIDVINGVLPNASSLNQLEKYQDVSELEEERRTFYVALTRARKQLKICSTKMRFENTTEESIFLKEVKEILGVNPIKTRLRPKEIQQDVEKIDVSGYKKNKEINHITFGKGRILMRNDNIAMVDFDSGGTKKIDLKTCIKYQLLI